MKITFSIRNSILSKRAAAALTFAAALLAAPTARAQLAFSGSQKPVITVTPESSTGLKAVYVVDNTPGVTASYTAASASSQVTWKRFSNLGGGYAEDVPFTCSGATTSVTLTADDMGYIVEEGGRQTCFWIVNYANHTCSLQALAVNPEADCSTTTLDLTGDAARISYYSVSGVQKQLSRDLTLEYNSMEYNADARSWSPNTVTENIEAVTGSIHCAAPLRDTEFTLSGDRFQRQWGQEQHVSTTTFATNAISAETWADQEVREADNEQGGSEDASTLGGSAPAVITFGAAVTDAVVFREWQFSADDRFDIIDLRINEDETTRTFEEYGTTYVRFVGGNADGSCEYISPTYQVYIGESRLECPNAFSPNDDGVNDQWKVSYKSLISFECHIYNRWGLEMCSFKDPSQGWDGRYNGKKVPSGVYYYVIQAKGSDGRNYKKAGDINIINYTLTPGSSGSGDITPAE